MPFLKNSRGEVVKFLCCRGNKKLLLARYNSVPGRVPYGTLLGRLRGSDFTVAAQWRNYTALHPSHVHLGGVMASLRSACHHPRRTLSLI